MDLFDYVNQARVWLPKSGDPIDIRDMTAVWRKNAARWLLRHAGTLYIEYRLTETMKALEVFVDREEREIWKSLVPLRETLENVSKPDQWIMGTALYESLVRDIPADPRDDFYWREVHEEPRKVA